MHLYNYMPQVWSMKTNWDEWQEAGKKCCRKKIRKAVWSSNQRQLLLKNPYIKEYSKTPRPKKHRENKHKHWKVKHCWNPPLSGRGGRFTHSYFPRTFFPRKAPGAIPGRPHGRTPTAGLESRPYRRHIKDKREIGEKNGGPEHR